MTTAALIAADFKTDPYDHQLIEFELSAEMPARALLWQMRTGKTKVVIDTACHLYREGKIAAVVVIAPNGVHENWVRRELPIHHWDCVDRDTLAWRTDVAGEKGIDRVKAHERRRWQEQHDAWWQRAERVLKTDRLAWFSLASETMTRADVRRLVQRIVRRKKGRILAVFDESHDFRTPGSKRTKMAMALARKCAYKRILTGTAVDNSPLHAWSQYQLLEEGALGFDTYGEFKKHHAVYEIQENRRGQRFPVLTEYKNLEELRDRMAAWSSVILRSDCHDLPDLIPMEREVEMTDEQKRVYQELHRQFEVELNGEEVSVGENTQKLVKLQQVASGFLKDEYGDVHEIPGGNPRLDALVDEVELTTGKVIIWCAFHEDMDRVAAILRARGHKLVEYHGRIGSEEKEAARRALEPGAENDVKALVGYPTAGLDLSAAGKIIWYSHTFDAIKRGQADERATAMGGENVPVMDFLAAGVDRYIRDNVREKVSIGDNLTREGMKEALRRSKI